MRHSSTMVTTLSKSPFHAPAAIALSLCGLVAAACSGPAASIPPGAASSQTTSGSNPTRLATSYTFQTVDDPNSSLNAVTGINQLSKIVGTYGAGSGSALPASYTSEPTYVKFSGASDPGAQGTVATSISSNRMIAGYVYDPGGMGGIWGFVRIKSIWSYFQDDNEGSGSNATTEILGINDSGYAVGYYVNGSGADVPFELDISNSTFTNLNPPSAMSAAATGIDGKGDTTGWESTSGGVIGWFLKAGTYYSLSYSGAKATYPLSLNWSDQVVGYYLDSTGISHGFILTGPTKGGVQQVWETVNDPKGAYGTVVTGINNHHDVCGYYYDASHVQHGFVAVPSGS
jgi:hypothetical protein